MLNRRVDTLIAEFDDCLQTFDRSELFGGPSLYFHRRTISRTRTLSLEDLLNDDLFYDYLYATLASWGLHRMGKTKTKLVDFSSFRKSILSQKSIFIDLSAFKLSQLNGDSHVQEKLKTLLMNLKIGVGEKRIVYNSKTVHHILPDLLPPIDRQYTLLFFFGNTNPAGEEMHLFDQIFPHFAKVANEKRPIITQIVSQSIDSFHSSESKVVDNAIVGYVLKHNLKK
jgi:hypothetical protein